MTVSKDKISKWVMMAVIKMGPAKGLAGRRWGPVGEGMAV